MKRFYGILLMVSLVILPVLYSCDNDDGYSLGDFSLPNWATVRVTGSLYYLDCDYWGTLYPVNTDMSWYQPVDGQRVLTVFNPLSDNFEGYDHAVKILYIKNALTKGVDVLTDANNGDFGNDPVIIRKGDLNISGGYLNIIFVQNLPKDVDTKHRISLVRSENAGSQETDGYIRLELRYNNYDDLSGVYAYGLVSFNLNSLNINSETKGIKLKLNSAENGEVEYSFDLKNSKQDNSLAEKTSNKDFSKMLLK
ncbi:MAG: NigD-like protein [Bacteroides sp.]|jgi:hypothetical protein|nr:NigD-like protein [Bacteroides sp.]MCI1681086.1 NigD-like protein [Bacteroides sp.]